MRPIPLLVLALAALFGQAAVPAQPSLQSGSVFELVQRLKAGEFLWAPEVAPEGPILFVISLATQRAVLYRNGIPIAITTVSTGRAGHRTPTGIFTVLERDAVHYSSLYNSAPMPHMQRLTWGGVALHGGDLPGYPASHGCIRLPHEFARLLFGVTRLGMTVVITGEAALPRIAPADLQFLDAAPDAAAIRWSPERSASGPVSIVVSAADRRILVLRNGRVIGTAPATVLGRLDRVSLFVLRSDEPDQTRWMRLSLPGQDAREEDLRGRIQISPDFRERLAPILRAGSTAVVTPDSLQAPGTRPPVRLLESR